MTALRFDIAANADCPDVPGYDSARISQFGTRFGAQLLCCSRDVFGSSDDNPVVENRPNFGPQRD